MDRREFTLSALAGAAAFAAGNVAPCNSIETDSNIRKLSDPSDCERREEAVQ